MKVRQMVKVEGLRRRLGREKFYPHPPAILTPDPSPTSGEGGKTSPPCPLSENQRGGYPRQGVVFILGGQAKTHPLAWGVEKSNPDDRAWERVNEEIRQSNERIFANYNRRKAAAMGGY